jgi:hypothetical protein
MPPGALRIVCTAFLILAAKSYYPGKRRACMRLSEALRGILFFVENFSDANTKQDLKTLSDRPTEENQAF